MDIENFSGPPFQTSPSPHLSKYKTPSTFYKSLEDKFCEFEEPLNISEFQIEMEMNQLSKLMSLSTLD